MAFSYLKNYKLLAQKIIRKSFFILHNEEIIFILCSLVCFMFIDIHCHLDMLDKEGVPVGEAVVRARKAGVGMIVVNGVNPRHNRAILALAVHYPEVQAALGMYPIDALALSDDEIDAEIEFMRRRKNDFAAVGEIGLDLKEDSFTDSFSKQKEVFEKFVKLALELDKPVIVHSRKAELETIELLEKLN